MFNISGLWSGRRTDGPAAVDSLDAFSSETLPEAPPVASSPRTFTLPRAFTLPRGLAFPRTLNLPQYLVVAIPIVVLVAGGVGLYRWRTATPPPAMTGISIESEPTGALVVMHGVPKGVTPLTLTVTPGEHAIELLYQQTTKKVRVLARTGVTVVHHVQFDSALPTPTLEPTAVRAEAAPSAPPATTSAGPVAGWVSVDADIPLQVLDNGQVIGTTASERIMVPAGRLNVRLVNDALGYSAERAIQVAPGKITTVKVDVPRAPLAINAVPWAEVWVDGLRVGETPIGNHLVALGNHEVILRHPQFGERRQIATVGLKSPSRVSVDMRRPQ